MSSNVCSESKPAVGRNKKKSSLKKKQNAEGQDTDSIASQLLANTKKNATPPTKVGTTNIKKETVDIKNFKSTAQEEAETKSDNSDASASLSFESKSFTKGELKAVWNANMEVRKAAEAPESELSILRRDFRLDGTTITIPIANQLEEAFAARFEQELTLHLRKELQNGEIKLKFILEVEAETQKLYTDKDKFDALAEQNPLLKELKDRLGLDYDF